MTASALQRHNFLRILALGGAVFFTLLRHAVAPFFSALFI
jgi:hypothetical protein